MSRGPDATAGDDAPEAPSPALPPELRPDAGPPGLPPAAPADPAALDAVADRGAGPLLARLRARRPLVHNITNLVVTNWTANVLLSLGASPAMVHSAEEVEDFVALSGALVINLGTLEPAWVAAMRLAARRAADLGVPFVLDPVGAGATPYRTRAAMNLLALKPAVVRANPSEVLALSGSREGAPKGVDATVGPEAALDAARAVAAVTGGVVAVTGAVDHVVAGERVVRVSGGSALMARVTGMGCAATALVGAALAAEPDAAAAAVAGLAFAKAAGAVAAEAARGPGSFAPAFLDALFALDPATLAARAPIEDGR